MRKFYLRPMGFLLAIVLSAAPSVLRAGQQVPSAQVSSAALGDGKGAPHMPMEHSGGMAAQSAAEKLPPREARKGVTALAGQTLQVDGEPLKHVKIEIDGENTYSDKTGRFLLENLAFGHHVLNVYGETAKPKRPYGFFQIAVEIEKGKTNILPFTMFIPVLDDQHATHFALQRDKEVVATTPLIPGLEVHIPPGEVLHGIDGKPLTEVTITAIPMMQMPMPGAPGTEPPISFTLQADGATDEKPDGTFGPGVSIVFPNSEHLRAGTRVDYWTYDPKIKGGWFIYGGGRVTQDGKQIVPDPGVVLHRLSCSPFNNAATPPTPPTHCPGGSSHCEGGEPVDLATGLFTYHKADMVINDIIPIVFGHTYRQMDNASRAFGIGAQTSYSSWLWQQPGTVDVQQADLNMPDGGKYHYNCISSLCNGAVGTVLQNSTDPGPFYMSTITSSTYPSPPFQGDNVYNLRLKDGTTYGYSLATTSGRLAYIRDRAGNQLNITFDSGDKPVLITSPSGRWIQLTYDTSNRVTQVQDNIGRTVSYTYDAGGRLFTVTDANGGVTTYTYDNTTNNNMVTITDARQILYLTNQYDANYRVIKQTQADGSVYQFAYTLDGSGNVTQTTVTNPRGDVRVVTFNTSSYWTSDTADSTGSAPAAVGAGRQPTSNLVTSSTDALGRQSSMTYDSMGNLTSITRLVGTPQAVTTSFTYDPTFNQVTSITDPLNHTTSFAYDNNGNLITVANPLDDQTTFAYNALGQPLTATDPLGNTTQFVYDPVSNDLLSVSDPLNRTATGTSDNVGRVVSVSDPFGHVTRYDYSLLNQITKITDPLGNQTALSYDGNGNLLNVTDANSHTTQYTYDSMDRVATRKDALLNQESYQYDGSGNLTQFTDRRGKVATFGYDSLNRLTFAGYGTQAGPTYESTVSYSYDAGNRLTQAIDSVSGTVVRDYDGLDRLVSEATPQGTVSYAYDAAGRRASLTVPGQADANYTFDSANRITQINQGSATISFTYDNAGRRTTMTLPNGIAATYNYDNASQLTGLTYATGSTTLGNLAYGYDLAGRRVSVGGSYARTNLPLPVSITAYNANNQLTTWGTANLFYDTNGNMTSDGTHSYTWDARNRLSQIDSGTTASFVYDPFGRRSSKTLSGTSTTLLYDGANAVQEVIGSNTANSLMGGVDEVFQRTDSAGSRSFLTDALGTTLGLADSSGTVQTTYSFDPFGNTTATGSANSNTFAYTGREIDAGNLYYYRARYYNPSTGRFLSEDPLGLAGSGPNFYGYVGGNPLRYRDPFGLSPYSTASCFLKGAAGGAAGAVVVGVLAVGAVTLGAPVAAVTGVLGVVAVVGGVALGVDVFGQISAGNVDGVAFDLGSLVGSSLVGGLGGRAIAEGINGVPSPPWSPASDLADHYDPDLGSFGNWLRTGPNPGSAGGSAALGGAGAATFGRSQCGCNP
jgi:RHS repeat-associated protein